MKCFKIGFVGIFAVVLVSGSLTIAQADEHLKKGPPAFSEFDADDNGQVTEDEFNSFRAERMAARAAAGKKMRGAADAPTFADVDTDGNGYIDAGELETAQKAHMAKRHQNMNGHGKGKRCKGKNAKMPTFGDFDTDSNGSIDEKEFAAVHAERMSKMAAEGKKMKNASKGPGFSGIDSDGDGQISPDELEAHQSDHCKKMKGSPQADNT